MYIKKIFNVQKHTSLTMGYLALCIAIFLTVQVSDAVIWDKAEISKLDKAFNNYLWHGVKTDDLDEYLKIFTKDFWPVESYDEESNLESPVDCDLCLTQYTSLISYVRSGGPISVVHDSAVQMCEKLWSKEFCEGSVNLNLPILIAIIQSNNSISAMDICKLMKQSACMGRFTPTPWEIDLHLNGLKKSKYNYKPSGKEPIKIAHVPDVHYDPDYKEGTNGQKCGTPCCCRDEDDVSPDPSLNGGYWGTYLTCEIPWRVVEQAVKEITKFNVSALYYTGDTTAHNVWSTTPDQITTQVNTIFNLFSTSLPNIPIYGALGNHEAQPSDDWAPASVSGEGFTMQFLYDDIAQIWSPWLSEEAIEQVKYAGYYTTKFSDGLRIISLNNNFCDINDRWLMLNTTDPFNQLQWLSDTLYQAELNNEVVHMIYHIPPGYTKMEIVCQQQFKKIILRYANVIKGQFMGHTHRDWLYNYYDSGVAVASAFNGGGLTTYTTFNPNFRILHIDPDTYDVVDYEQYVFNMTEANLNGQNPPVWYKLYTFTEFFGVDSATPLEVDKAIINMAKNDTLAQEYLRMATKNSDLYDPNSCTTDKCLDNNLCTYVTTDFTDQSDCDRVKSIRHGNK